MEELDTNQKVSSQCILKKQDQMMWTKTDISQVRDQYREDGDKVLSFHRPENIFKLLNDYQHFKKNCAP